MEKIRKNNDEINVSRLSDIKSQPVSRFMTGFEELDYIYGYSQFPMSTIWGMPQCKISLWAGVSGIGKSRLCISVAKAYCKTYLSAKVLYFQTESTLEDFAGWAKDTTEYPNIYCSGENKIDRIIKAMYQIKPQLVFIDSVNEIEEFENGNKHESRRLIQGSDGMPGLRQAINEVGCHLILLGQLNQDRKTIKGGTSLPHLVDIALDLVPLPDNNYFMVKVGLKHRYGKKDSYAVFEHNENGVIPISSFRLEDLQWCKSHGIAVTPAPTAVTPAPTAVAPVAPTAVAPTAVAPTAVVESNNLGWTPMTQERYDEIKRNNPPSLYRKIGDIIGDILGK